MPDSLPKEKKIIPISQAAEILGVSIDTIRRWDKEGILHSERPNGKDRYFSLEELEKQKLSKPLSISEVAELLHISPSTLRRLEKQGLFVPQRDNNGERIYTRKSLEDFLDSQYFLRKNEVEEKILEPLKEIKPKETADQLVEGTRVEEASREDTEDLRKLVKEMEESNNKAIALLSTTVASDSKQFNKIRKRTRFVFRGISLFFFASLLIVACLTFLFLEYPSRMAELFAYQGVGSTTLELSRANTPTVLGAQTSIQQEKAPIPEVVMTTLLRPYATISLQIVKAIQPVTYSQVAPQVFPQNISNAIQVNQNGQIVPNAPIVIQNNGTSGPNLKILDKDVITNLNADFVQGKRPGIDEGDLVVFGPSGSVAALQVGPNNIAPDSLTTEVLGDSSVTSTKIAEGTILNGNISDEAAIADTKLAQISSSNKVAGSAVELSSSGGLTDNSGLSLLTSCSSNQTLIWNGSTWACGTSSSGTITGVTSGNGLTGGGTSGNISIAVLLPTNGTSSITSSNSGFEVGSSGVSLLRGCSDQQILTWNATNSLWQCANQTGGGGGGVATLQEGGSNVVTSATTLNFTASDFNITNSGAGTGLVAIDYANSNIARKNQNETISGNYTFSSATPIALSSTSPTISIGNTGTLSITDGTNTLLSLVDNGTTGIVTVTGGLTVSAGSVSLPAGSIANAALANASLTVSPGTGLSGGGSVALGSTTTLNLANTAVSAGSYGSSGTTVPTFTVDAQGRLTAAGSYTISGLTASNLTAGDFSGAITSGTYAINISGSAGSATSATTATNATNVATTQVSNSATYYPLFVGSSTNGNQAASLGTDLTFNPNTNTLTTTTFSGALSGNATTATTLQTGRTINGVTFDGSGNITVTAAAGTLTGSSINSSVTGSSLTSVGTLGSLTVSGGVNLGDTTIASGKLFTITGGSGNPTATNGTIWYDTAANKFKIVENGTVKTICNTTDLGCGSGSGSVAAQEGGSSVVAAATAFNYLANDFTVTDQGSNVAGIAIDYTNSHITRTNQAETVTGGWTFNTGSSTFTSSVIANGGITTASGTNLSLAAGGTGQTVLTSDGDTGVLIGSSGNTPAVLSVSGGIGGNAAAIINSTNSTNDILTASTSGTTKFTIKSNGDIAATGALTGATIAAGSNTISGLTATNLTAGDFSSKINSGTYSINISGSAGTATSATSATTATNANNVATTGTSTNANFFPLFVSSSTNGNQAPDLNSGFTFNPSTGTLTATTFSGALSGNATTATTLQNARTINGVSFDGSGNITVTAAAGTLTGATLNSGVTASSLTSVGNLVNGTVVGTDTFNSHAIADSGALTITAASGSNITLGSNVGNGNVQVNPNAGGQAAFMVIDNGQGDLFTASSGATPKFTVANNGNIAATGTLTGLTGLTVSSGSVSLPSSSLSTGALTGTLFVAGATSGTTTQNISQGNTLTFTAGTDITTTGAAGSITFADNATLSSVTGRGASTSNALTLSSSSNNITAGTLTATGGTIDGIAIGGTTRATGKFTSLDANTTVTLSGLGAGTATTSLCLDGSNNVKPCTSGGSTGTLQSDYNNGNTINLSNNNLILGNNVTGVGNVFINPDAGGAAALIVNKQGPSGDIIDASASGSTVFQVSKTGALTAATSNTINGINITSGAITGATIAAGSNTISGLTASNLTAGDFSSKITSGTYSINISGSAGSATSATNATNTTNVATTAKSDNATYYPLFVGSSSNSNQAADLGTGLTFNPNTNTLTTTTFSGALSGNASTATKLQTARNINGVSFDGSADITVTAAAGTLTGTTLNAPVVTSSLTSVGTLTGLTVSGSITANGGIAETKTISANSGTTNTINALTLTTPVDSSGTNVYQGLAVTPSLGNSTNGTNTVNFIETDPITAPSNGKVNINALSIGALTSATSATENALSVGSGWDSVLVVNGTTVVNGSGQVPAAQINGTVSTATTATNANNVNLANDTTNATDYLVFTNTATGNQPLKTNTGISVNPSTGVLTATTFSGALSGNATTATALQTPRTINGVSFNGSANISITSIGTDTFTNNTITDSGALSLVTSSNGDITFSPNGSGNTVVASDADSGLKVGSSGNTLALLSVSGAIGNNAAAIINNNNNGNILVASSSGATKFVVDTNGQIISNGTTIVNSSGQVPGSVVNGAVSSATNATNVATTSTANNATYYPLFVSSSSNGNQAANLGTGLTFNPNTNTLTTTTFSGALSGNATTATTLQNARTINGVSFDGSGNITVTAAAGTLTGNTLASGVTASSLTSVGTLTGLTISGSTNAALSVTSTDATSGTDTVSVTNAHLTPAGGATSDNLNLTYSDLSTNTSGTAIAAGITLSPTYNVSGAGTHRLVGINFPAIATNTCGAGTCQRYGLYFPSSNNYDDIIDYNGQQIISGTGVLSTSTSVVTGSYTGITGTGALDAGSITSNFGAINNGTHTISSGAHTVTSSSADALDVGANGSTNPAFKVSASAASQQNGLVVTGSGSSNAVTLTIAGGGTNIPLTINSNGTGILTLDSAGTGEVDVAPANATTVKVGTSTTASTISIGTGTGGNTINIGTDNTTADTIGIGSAKDALTLSSAHFAVTSAGAVSGVTTLGLSGAITGQTATNTINGMIINSSSQTFSANTISDSGALTINSGSGANNITLQAGGSGTTARVLIGSGNGGSGSSTPDLLGLDILASGQAAPTGFNGAMYFDANSNQFKCYQTSWQVCLGTGATLNQISAATANQAGIANGSNSIEWDWGSQTSQNAMIWTGGTAITSGTLLSLGKTQGTDTVFNHTTTENGAVEGITFEDNSTGGSSITSRSRGLYINANASSGASSGTDIVTSGLAIDYTLNESGTAVKDAQSINILAPTITTCSGGCNGWDGLQIGTTNTTATMTQNGIHIIPSTTTGANSTTNGIKIDSITTSNGTDTAINIGSGWDNAISAAGNIEIESKTNTAATAQNTWTVKNATAGTFSSTTVIASISASAVYNGSLYAGTYNNGRAEVYRYNGSTLNTFTALNSTPGTLNSTSAIDGITSMAVYNGYLYVGTSKVGASGQAEVYRYDGSSTFTAVNSAAGTIGGVANIASVSAMAVWNGDLYAGVCKSGAAEVFKYQGGTTWLAVSGAGTIATTTGVDCITSLVSYNNYLIAGDAKAASAEVYRYTGGTGWIRLNPTAGQFTVTSSGGSNATSVDAVTQMVVYNGHLVVGLREKSKGDLVEYDDVTGALAPVNDWSRLNNAAGTMVSSGTTINSVSALGVYNGILYAGTEATNGAEIWMYNLGEAGATGSNWTKVSQNAAGNIAGGGTTQIGMITQLIQYNNDLWAGTYKTGAAELYNYTTINGQSYALKFHASGDLSEQNSLENLGSISFVASPSANMGNGGFVFSNGIVTNAGAYDVAEDYPTRDQLIQPGDLVSIDTAEKGLVKRSEGKNSNTVIGVYSAHPGFDLSQSGSSIDGIPAIPVALVGRVPVNVSSESGVIKSGDYIASSSLPGVGMKAVSAGPIIGQALQDYDPSLADNTGIEQILVFVSHGYYNGISQDQLTGLSSTGDLSAVQFIGTPTAGSTAVLGANTQDASSSADLTLNSLSVNGLATISGDLRVKQNVLVEGVLHVVDSILANTMIVNGVSDFFGNVIFHTDVNFVGRPTFNSDTAGFAIIKQGAQSVRIVFDKEYENAPVVTASISMESGSDDSTAASLSATESAVLSGLNYAITGRSTKGFTIKLNVPATEDIEFSWSAVAVQNAKTFQSSDTLQVTPIPTVSSSSGSTTIESFPTETLGTPTPTLLPQPTQ